MEEVQDEKVKNEETQNEETQNEEVKDEEVKDEEVQDKESQDNKSNAPNNTKTICENINLEEQELKETAKHLKKSFELKALIGSVLYIGGLVGVYLLNDLDKSVSVVIVIALFIGAIVIEIMALMSFGLYRQTLKQIFEIYDKNTKVKRTMQIIDNISDNELKNKLYKKIVNDILREDIE